MEELSGEWDLKEMRAVIWILKKYCCLHLYHTYILQLSVVVKIATAFILFSFLEKLRLSALWKIIST